MNEANEEGKHHHHASAPADVYLYSLLEMLDADESLQSQISATLMVNGGLVCGELISHARWVKEFEDFVSSVRGQGADKLTQLLHAVADLTPPRPDDQMLTYVHLRQARIITNYRSTLSDDVQQGPEFPLWRTRLADVQGWTLGRP